MNKEKVNKVVEELMRSGFSMTTEEFFETTVYKILQKYQIKEKLTVDEYFELLRQLIDVCAEYDLKNMGIECLNNNDWKYK